MARLNRLLKNSGNARQLPSAAGAVIENRSFIAGVNRCATQEQKQRRAFQHTVKPCPSKPFVTGPFIAAVNRRATQKQNEILVAALG
jgi:hypothetical protein